MEGKRRHKTLTLREKYDIIKHLEEGRCVSELAITYKVGKSTICDIKRKKADIVKFVTMSETGPGKRMTLKSSENPNVELALYSWFIQERSRHTPLSGDIVCEKAKHFYRQITGKDDFKASSGWFHRFKKRYGIRQLTVCGEKLSSNESAVQPFQREFLHKVNEMGLVPDQVYNADESGLFWRMLPNKTLVHQKETSAPGRKISKDRITFMACANATGSHKLKLLVIGKAQNPRAFKNCTLLPVVYKAQSKGWVTRELFSQWFHHEFVPAVREKMKELNLPPKALLILDNAPGHPDKEELTSADKQIQTLFLPPNCTPLLQPMDQHVIQNIKLRYRKSLLTAIVADELPISQCLKKLDLKMVVFSLRDAWCSVPSKLIQKSWKQLWPTQNLLTVDNIADQDFCFEDLIPLAELRERIREEKKVQEEEQEQIHIIADVFNRAFEIENKITPTEVKEWVLENDENLIFTDEHIIQNVQDVEDDPKDIETTSKLVKHADAIKAFETCLNWSSENDISIHQILILREMRDEALKAQLRELKQKKISDFFSSNDS